MAGSDTGVASLAVSYLRARSWGLPGALVMMVAIGAARWVLGGAPELWLANSLLHRGLASMPDMRPLLDMRMPPCVLLRCALLPTRWPVCPPPAPQGPERHEHPAAWVAGLPGRPGGHRPAAPVGAPGHGHRGRGIRCRHRAVGGRGHGVRPAGPQAGAWRRSAGPAALAIGYTALASSAAHLHCSCAAAGVPC